MLTSKVYLTEIYGTLDVRIFYYPVINHVSYILILDLNYPCLFVAYHFVRGTLGMLLNINT